MHAYGPKADEDKARHDARVRGPAQGVVSFDVLKAKGGQALAAEVHDEARVGVDAGLGDGKRALKRDDLRAQVVDLAVGGVQVNRVLLSHFFDAVHAARGKRLAQAPRGVRRLLGGRHAAQRGHVRAPGENAAGPRRAKCPRDAGENAVRHRAPGPLAPVPVSDAQRELAPSGGSGGIPLRQRLPRLADGAQPGTHGRARLLHERQRRQSVTADARAHATHAGHFAGWSRAAAAPRRGQARRHSRRGGRAGRGAETGEGLRARQARQRARRVSQALKAHE